MVVLGCAIHHYRDLYGVVAHAGSEKTCPQNVNLIALLLERRFKNMLYISGGKIRVKLHLIH